MTYELLPRPHVALNPCSMWRWIDMLAVRGYQVAIFADSNGWGCVISPSPEFANEWPGGPIASSDGCNTLFVAFGQAVTDWYLEAATFEAEIQRFLRAVGE